ncbi:NAD(P)-binding domain-containingprotein [Purpureocillium lilacinum]|uniref:NAD(P)-binding domain-containingprotein n=1 Tax=Purpureocillium lilacinum TaxID=33203 RepID=A0A179FUS0_PURLI|nr:NAD(P)-binding domain-containingprotein [Purpureocillium lilacinum]OAQ69395.1 NAD(P)-binding domain-containingprotein [Purpureocillium lilacinum]OAQ76818.1 NAD(P)-binding domain-containingprotein [Purpureocillium lilacinum]
MVTGGTKGIGRAIVEALLSEGANVSYCARSVRGDEFASLASGAADAPRAIGTAVDIGDASAIRAWIEVGAQEFGRVDGVVANAASFAVEATYESWQRSFQADILGLIALIDTATPHLQSSTSSDASIVVVSSLAGFEARHPAIAGPYSTLKRAQATLAKDYSRKLGPLGVRINTVVPGAIETRGETLPDGTWQPSRFEEAKKTKPEFLREMLDGIPLARFGDAEDVASAAVFLLSPLARYISGTNLVVDGGSSIAF